MKPVNLIRISLPSLRVLNEFPSHTLILSLYSGQAATILSVIVELKASIANPSVVIDTPLELTHWIWNFPVIGGDESCRSLGSVKLIDD